MTELSTVTRNFVLHWGELGARWGISRTMAQIHALLYISTKPLCHEEIAETLNVARSNVSTSIRELKSWGIVKVVPVMNDRRDHYEAIKDGWEMLRIILGERMHREVQPTLEILRQCANDADTLNENEEVRERFRDLLDCVETLNSAYEQIREVPTSVLVKLAKLGGKIPVKLGLFSKKAS